MIGHLGAKVSALLDGQLSPAETERAWAHVHACHFCRDAVEREGWTKTQLTGLGSVPGPPSYDLVGALLDPRSLPPSAMPARRRALTAAGGGAAAAVGAAVVGVLALGATPTANVADRGPSAALSRPDGPQSAVRTAATYGPVAASGVMAVANPVLSLIAFNRNPLLTQPTRAAAKPDHHHRHAAPRGKMNK